MSARASFDASHPPIRRIRRATVGALALLLLSGPPRSTAAQAGSAAPAPAGNPFGRVYPARVYTTARLQGPAPRIDGRLDDEAWKEGAWSADFKQQIPTEGAPPSQATELKILYDARNLYFAIRAYDDPAKMHRWPGRRDDFVGDIVGVCFDSDHDKRSGFEFDLTAGGSKIDLILGNGANEWDTNWDAVWHGAVGLEKDAWTAEFQVPLSQLRYSGDEQIWGLHAWRWIDRNQEEVQWQLIPRQNTGRMHQLGELHGIRGLDARRPVELLPHALGRAANDPGAGRGAEASGSLGLDAKVGLSTNFTLDATVNPDFGQVESDPSVMNLTAFETFFDEKRPFFLEGRSILGFGIEDSDTLFYSRRIGHAPSLSPRLAPGETARPPESTTILGAVKVTGKTSSGLSIGVIQSVTQRETVRVEGAAPGPREETVEPWGSYTVARVHRDWDKGNTSLGAMLTHTRRGSEGSSRTLLPETATAVGLDFAQYLANRSWVIEARGVASRISGDPQAIRAVQTNPVHYYQRPGASHLGVEEAATSLSGHGGALRFGRTDKGRLRLSSEFNWYSPGLELNDLGFLRQADVLANATRLGWNEAVPRGLFRSYSLQLSRLDSWDFGGLKTWGSTELDLSGQFKNKWNGSAGLRWIEPPVDTRLLRGGPALRTDSFLCTNGGLSTDDSARVGGSVSAHGHFHSERLSRQSDLGGSAWVRPTRTLRLSANLSYSGNRDDLQYVSTAEAAGDPRFLLGRIAQRTWSLTFRANLSLTPNLTLQYYGSPFVSTGRYGDFKRATDTLAASYGQRIHAFAPGEIGYDAADNRYQVGETAGPAYAFGNPDFSFRQFRSNLVLRWEYRPGSSLFAVWSQGRTSAGDRWQESLGANWDALWAAAPQNVFLVKVSYWFAP